MESMITNQGIKRFIRGIKLKINQHLLNSKFASMDEAIQKAKQIEREVSVNDEIYKIREDAPALRDIFKIGTTASQPEKQNITCFGCKKEGHIMRFCPNKIAQSSSSPMGNFKIANDPEYKPNFNLSKQQSNSYSRENLNNYNNHPGNMQQYQQKRNPHQQDSASNQQNVKNKQYSSNQGHNFDRVITCHNCKTEGHYQRDCKLCAFCDKIGHNIKDCKIFALKCSKCKVRGHTEKYCTLEQRRADYADRQQVESKNE